MSFLAQSVTLILLFVSFIAATGCKPRKEMHSSASALLLPSVTEQNSLLPRIHKPRLKFCISAAPELDAKSVSEVRTKLQPQIEQAAYAWVDPLRSVANQRFFEGVDFLEAEHPECQTGGNYDLFIQLVSATNYRDRYSPETRTIDMKITNAAALLHELGHAMGLDDTYVENGFGCKSGHPVSVMCPLKLNGNPLPNTLNVDDIVGIRAAYCRIHSSRTDLCTGQAEAGPRPNLDVNGNPFFEIGVTLEEGTGSCTGKGPRISTVAADSPAERAQLKAGYCITSIGNMEVQKVQDFNEAISLSHISLMTIVYAVPTTGNSVIAFINAATHDDSVKRDLSIGDIVFPAHDRVAYTADWGVGVFERSDVGTVLRFQDDLVRVRIGYGAGWVKKSELEKVIIGR